MRRGLRFVAIGVPVLMSLAVNIVLARPSKMTREYRNEHERDPGAGADNI